MTRLRSLLSRLALAGVAVTACAEYTPVEPAIDAGSPSFTHVSLPFAVLKLEEPIESDLRASAVVGPRGGEIALDAEGVEFEIEIPAGALEREQRIDVLIPAGDNVQVRFGPHGLQFQRPVRVSLELGGVGNPASVAAAGASVVYFTGEIAADGSVAAAEVLPVKLDVQVEDGEIELKAEFEITHFSGYCVTDGRSKK